LIGAVEPPFTCWSESSSAGVHDPRASALLLWNRRDRRAEARNVRKWQGVVAGGLTVCLGSGL